MTADETNEACDGRSVDDAATPATEIAGYSPQDRVADVCQLAFGEMHKVVVGQDALLRALLIALFADGHVLLEGVPGTAKTLAVRCFARVFGALFSRVQFTPDLMPSDIIGTNVFDPRTAEFRLRKGPVFTGVLLADEINRTPPKTQSALLEAMEERAVTIDGTTHRLPEPFLVCATQNPIEFEGTYPLPEAQLDRFMLKVNVEYPAEHEETEILGRYQAGFRATDLDSVGIRCIVRPPDLRPLREAVNAVTVTPEVRGYMTRLCRAARSHRDAMLGPSPRGTIYLLLTSKVVAAMNRRNFVTPDDVKAVAHLVLRHRVLMRPESEMEGITPEHIIQSVLDTVEVPR